jgi:hypothetical protein
LRLGRDEWSWWLGECGLWCIEVDIYVLICFFGRERGRERVVQEFPDAGSKSGGRNIDNRNDDWQFDRHLSRARGSVTLSPVTDFSFWAAFFVNSPS